MSKLLQRLTLFKNMRQQSGLSNRIQPSSSLTTLSPAAYKWSFQLNPNRLKRISGSPQRLINGLPELDTDRQECGRGLWN